MRSALFLDLGGTLVRIEDDEIYVDRSGKVELLPGVVSRISKREQDLVLVVTNQSGLSKGAVSPQEVAGWFAQVDEALGGVIDDYWACPTLESAFRKPSPGMVLALADKHFVDLKRSIFVGDTESDQACAEAAGVRFVPARDFFSSRT